LEELMTWLSLLGERIQPKKNNQKIKENDSREEKRNFRVLSLLKIA